MRHVWSLLSGIAAAAAVLSLSSLDLDGTGRWWAPARLVGVGLIAGLVATTRISPVGSIVGGLVLLTPLALMEIDYSLFRDVFSSNYESDIFGLRLQSVEIGENFAVLGVIGAVMIVAAVSRQRWLAWPQPVDGVVDNGPVDAAPAAVGAAAGAHDGITEQLWVQPR
jgi:hypothetical protein